MNKILVAGIFSLSALISAAAVYPIFQTPRLPVTSLSLLLPTMAPTPTPLPVYPSSIGAWLAYWDEKTTLMSLTLAQSTLNRISPVWYRLNSDGSLTSSNPKFQNQIIRQATASGLALIPTINNDYEQGFDPARVSVLLSNTSAASTLSNSLISLAKANHYSGWDLDWEEVSAGDRDKFSDFVKDLANILHASKLTLSVTVGAQTGAGDWTGTRGMDLAKLGQSADEIRLMIYDYHESSSGPGPLSPLDWLEKTINYTKSLVPVDKITVGLPTYGYDWTGNKANTVLYTEALQLLTANHGSWSRDPDTAELVGSYMDTSGRQHNLWFQDAESVVVKMKAAGKLGVSSFYFWRLGGEDPHIWPEITALKSTHH